MKNPNRPNLTAQQHAVLKYTVLAVLADKDLQRNLGLTNRQLYSLKRVYAKLTVQRPLPGYEPNPWLSAEEHRKMLEELS